MLLSIALSLENLASIKDRNYIQEILLLKLLEEFGFDAYELIIFSNRNGDPPSSQPKPSCSGLFILIYPIYQGGKENVEKKI